MFREVLLLDDDLDVREPLAELVELLTGRRCLSVGSFAEMVALGPRALACETALLDLELGSRAKSGIDAFRWLRAHGFTGRVYFLSAYAPPHALVSEAQQVAAVVRKPIENEELCRLIDGS